MCLILFIYATIFNRHFFNDEWENLRIKVLKNEIWNTEFNNIKNLVYSELKKNNYL